jgi:hypothetical protein
MARFSLAEFPKSDKYPNRRATTRLTARRPMPGRAKIAAKRAITAEEHA